MAKSKNWITVAESGFPWERDALDFVRSQFPTYEPYRAWSNFEFIAGDGSINEVDLLLLTPKGFYLVEIKSRPGRVEGDAGTWSWRKNGRGFTDDNPLILANRKAKKLKSLLSCQKAMKKVRSPYLEAHVFHTTLEQADISCHQDAFQCSDSLVCNQLQRGLLGEIPDHAVTRDRALLGIGLAGQRLQQRRLARPVPPDQAHLVAGLERKRRAG